MKKSKINLIAASLKGKIQLICGIGLVIFSMGGFSVEIPARDVVGIIIAIAVLSLGLFLIYRFYRIQKLISRFRLYVSILSNQSSMSIYALSQTAGFPEQQVAKELQTMIDRRFFADAYIDRGKRCLVFPLMEQEAKKETTESDDDLYVTTVCPICGGSNRVVSGKNNRCMYCDNIIRK